SSEPVSQELLDKAYEVSMKTPSVCNRQATRVYQITDSEKIKAALSIQGGFHGYAMPPVLLLVTSDIRAFMNNGERNEPFVDGGLFSMSLLYALEAYGLAACPLNAMFSLSQDRQTRALLNMPDYELPVMYIAVGNFPESVPVCRSTRRDPKTIVTKL
ncbi:nitroreductase family protein, partial [Algiphilus sp. NNCM1]|nr:nitroreductase family protein [Algiphilus acroporae]